MGILTAFILALIVLVLIPGTRTSTIDAVVLFFFILFLAGIAGSLWIVPFGPVVYGVSWLPMLFFILLVAFLFSSPPPGQRTTTGEAAASVAAVSIFVWLLFAVLIIAVAGGYFIAHK